MSLETLLINSRKKNRTAESELINTAKQLLANERFSRDKILENLKQYNRSFEVIDETDAIKSGVFTLPEIKEVAINYRLQFLNSADCKLDFPEDVLQTIAQLNRIHAKDLKAFKVLGTEEVIRRGMPGTFCLFVKTNAGNYFLVYQLGTKFDLSRRWKYWHLRRFETLVFALLLFTATVAAALPTALITLDGKADYWSGYRGGVFFHLLFFFTGFTTYFMLAFSIRLSSNGWDRK